MGGWTLPGIAIYNREGVVGGACKGIRSNHIPLVGVKGRKRWGWKV